MNRFWRLCTMAFVLLATGGAQETLPSGFEQWTAASLKQFDQKMHDQAAQDPHHFAVEQLADFPNENFLLVHREADGQVEWHET